MPFHYFIVTFNNNQLFLNSSFYCNFSFIAAMLVIEYWKLDLFVRFLSDDAASLEGVWLHRQGLEDAISIGEGADEDDVEMNDQAFVESDPELFVLDQKEISAFDCLSSLPAAQESNNVAMSNVELLSSVLVVNVEDKTAEDDAFCFENILPSGRLEEDTLCDGLADGLILTGSMTSSMIRQSAMSDSSFNMRPRTGSVIESGRGDLVASPVRSATSNASLPRIPSLLRVAKAKLSLPWKTGAAAGLTDGQTEYIIDAAELISQAQEHEYAGNYQAAFCKYKSGIGILLKGVQSKCLRIRRLCVC